MPTLTHLNPDGLHQNPGFSQAVLVPAGHAQVFVGGQQGADPNGAIVSDDLKEQATQAFRNIETCVQAAGAEATDIAKWTIYANGEDDVMPGFQAFQEFWGNRGAPPAITVALVSGFARPGVRCEIDAVAVVPSA